MKLIGLDYLGISEFFSDEELLVQKSSREFVDNEILPIIDKHFKEGTFPMDLIKKFGDLGYLGMNLPEKYGCAGLSNIAYGLLCQELERADSGIRSFASVQGSLVMYPIYAYGSEEQKMKWLPQLAKGEKIGCFGLTEPNFGSNPSGMLTNAKKVNGGYTLNGSKILGLKDLGDKDIIKAVKIISVCEATSILKYTLTKPVIPLDLNESDIARSQKSDFATVNLKENITH